MPLESCFIIEKGEKANICLDMLLKAEDLCSCPGRSTGGKNIFKKS